MQVYIVSIIGFLVFSFVPLTAFAEEVAVTGNGSDTLNEGSASNNDQTSVNQSNSADVSNSVNVDTNTGDNLASDNTSGDTQVTTGNASVSTSISNTANASTVTQDCCLQSGDNNQAVISGNGTGSQNTVGVSNISQTTVTSVQSAQITNIISGTAITGNNRANNNTSGNVTIQTGDITINEKIHNKINHATISLAAFVAKETTIKISGNGSFSDNTVDLENEHEIRIDIDNRVDVFNQSTWDLITGGNKADDNTDGAVSIFTGNIAYSSVIKNAVNESSVTVNSCPEEKEKEKPQAPVDTAKPPSENKTSTTTENKPSGGGGGRGGEVIGASAQNLLPITGNNWFYFALFANVIMLFFGAMLRLRAGRSPNFAIV